MNVHFQCVVQVCRSSCPEPQCGGAGPVDVDTYGAPAAPPVNVDTYGSPAAPPNGAINPRTPGGQYSSGSDRRVAIVRPDTPGVRTLPIPLKADSLQRPQPGYTNFNKRMGVEDLSGNGGRPRSLEFGEGIALDLFDDPLGWPRVDVLLLQDVAPNLLVGETLK